MEHTLTLPEFGDQVLVVTDAGLFSAPRLLVNGQPATPGAKRGEFHVTRPDGTTATVTLRSGFPDPAPVLQVDGRRIPLVEPLSPLQWFFAGLPLALLLVGGALGGALGAVGFTVNARAMRSDWPPPLRYLFVGGVSVATTLVYLVLAVILSIVLGR
jgi:hypothetical protein